VSPLPNRCLPPVGARGDATRASRGRLARVREAIERLCNEHGLSERRVCRLVGLARDSYRHPPEADQLTTELGNKIVEIAHARRRFGYRRIHDLLRPEYPGVNHKRVYRLYSAANLALRKRKKTKRPASAPTASTLRKRRHRDPVQGSFFRSSPSLLATGSYREYTR
jgi:hypothetical protein